MYQVSVFNGEVETIIHYPTADTEVSHLNKLDLKEGLSLVDSLSFSLYPNNPGYDKVFELTTKVKVIDSRDNSIRFTGRVLSINEKMDSGGVFCKEILCEGGLSYLNDTKTRSETFLGSPSDFTQWILNKHNTKVEDAKKIQVGNIDVIGSVAYTCDFKSTLETLLEAKEKLGGDIRVRETNGLLYLDWLQSFYNNTTEITLGLNMKEMIKHKDITSLGTRIIPLGANNLTIADINNGIDYIEDINAETVYGVLEKAVEYREITDPIELYNKALEDLPNHTQPLYLLESGALDLSFITGNKAEQFVLGANLHVFNLIMAVDNVYKVVALDLDLLKPYDPKLTIANFPVKLTNTINDLRKTSVQNNGVYNSVQVGDAFGIRAVRSDGKVITTLNAIEGISIENGNIKVFYVDENGTLRAVKGIFDDITANNMIANEMRTSNTSSYIILHDQYMDFFKNGNLVMQLGFEPTNAFPSVLLYNNEGQSNGIAITGSGELAALGAMSFDSPVNFYSTAKIGGDSIATRDWVMNYVSSMSTPSEP
ncbi:phage tail spike protein [Clostridium sp. BSD9I1]|uniref:phage tail spike protein n=1 Tax=Clostridium sp. BSD9I1 TaxID=2003589 RepID=UPI00164784AC|nr:phage tail spike protein [Clostridium sp. BSD9I1]